MALTIHLPPALEDELAEEARQLGLELPEYVVNLLHRWRGSESDESIEDVHEKVLRVLAASGQVRLPQPDMTGTPYVRQTPVTIPGESVSEIVIEQRGEL